MILTIIFKVKHLLVTLLQEERTQAADVNRQICLDSHGPRRGVASRLLTYTPAYAGGRVRNFDLDGWLTIMTIKIVDVIYSIRH